MRLAIVCCMIPAFSAAARAQDGWQIAGVVPTLLGHDPRAAQFGPASVDLITTMLGPNEARCCPTVETRWRIDLTAFIAQRLN